MIVNIGLDCISMGYLAVVDNVKARSCPSSSGLPARYIRSHPRMRALYLDPYVRAVLSRLDALRVMENVIRINSGFDLL
jgi:hypothetical protein